MIPNEPWKLPAPLELLEVAVDESTTVTLRRHGNADGPRLVLSHGSGLAIDLYYPFWSLLADQFDLLVYDFRNHGWNPVGDRRSHNLPAFVSDNKRIFRAIDDHFGNKPRIGVFHSISALTALLQHSNSGFSALVLFDPPLCKPGFSAASLDSHSERLAKFIRQRASKFESRTQFAKLLRYAPQFDHVLPGVMDLVSQTTLRDCSSGTGYELCCPPEYEAQAIEHIYAWAVLVEFEKISCPIKVIGADPTLPYSFLPTTTLDEVARLDYDFVPESTHLLQLEQPEVCVAMMLRFLERIGLDVDSSSPTIAQDDSS